jgi:thiamine-phosphate pyrophosphorylase
MSEFDLCVITRRVESLRRDHFAVAQAALNAGSPMVQLRDKELSTLDLIAVARQMRTLTRRHGASFIVNDRADIAFAAEADGVHLGPDDLSVTDARRLLGSRALIGASVANVGEARAAEVDGATYVSVGAVFATGSKPDAGPPVGTDLITTVRNAVRLPVLAIGGITCDNVASVIDAGANGAAVVSAVAEAADMEQAARRLLELIRTCLSRRGAHS